MTFNESRFHQCALYALAGVTGFVCGAYFQQEASIRHLFSVIRKDPHIFHHRHKLYPLFSTFRTDHEMRLWSRPPRFSDKIRESLVSPLFDMFSAFFMMKADSDIVRTSDLLDLMKYGLPSTENLYVHKDYIVSHDLRTNTPTWICEHLQGDYQKFSSDDDGGDGINLRFNDVYVLSCAAPRICKAFKRRIWHELEEYISDVTEKFGSVYAYTGPIYTPTCHRDGNWSMDYEVFDWIPIPVPSHYFKVLIIDSELPGCGPYMEGYIIENSHVVNGTLNDHLAQIEEIERYTGLCFNKGLRPTVLYDKNVYKVSPQAWMTSGRFEELSEPLLCEHGNRMENYL